MRVLVTYGTKRGGTEGIAHWIGGTLEKHGFEVTVAEAGRVRDAKRFDAAVIGGALYANRWQRDARRFVLCNVAALRHMPVWFFSSGPLDESTERTEIPPPPEVSVLMERIGALGHVTFGGRLGANAQGFPASAVAREHHGDYRNPERIRAWAENLAEALPHAKPGVALEHPAHSIGRLGAHGFVAWAISAGVSVTLSKFASPALAITGHSFAVAAVFTLVSLHYFRARGARDPLFTAASFTLLVALFGAPLVGSTWARNLGSIASFTEMWLPLLLVFLATWSTGSIVAMMPVAKPPRASVTHDDRGERDALRSHTG